MDVPKPIKSVWGDKIFPKTVHVDQAVIRFPNGVESGNWQTRPTDKTREYITATEHARIVAEKDARIAELRGLMWYAWHEFNAIRARDGAPKASDWNDPKLVDEAYWSQLTDAFAAAIGEEATTPWPSPEARAALKGDDNG